MGYNPGRIGALKAELAAFPKLDPSIRELSKQETIRRLAPEIAALRRRGYRLRDIAEMLRERGLEMNVRTLSGYLRRARRSPRPTRRSQPAGDVATVSGRGASTAVAPRVQRGAPPATAPPREDSDDI